uniref:Uncharacterized protein n=1 Tax=Rhizophora mucronata TaxID=61149 RepID=A0A2P2JFZ5_RHIMU
MLPIIRTIHLFLELSKSIVSLLFVIKQHQRMLQASRSFTIYIYLQVINEN